jgi:cell division protein FtsQ
MVRGIVSSTARTSSAPLPSIGFRIYRALQWLIIVGVVIGLVWGWKFLKDPTQFPVKKVKVEAGYQHLDRQALQQLVIPYVGHSFFDVDVKGLKQSLSQLPWVAEVKVQRVWPDTVVIKVSEQQPAAQFGSQALINAQGQVFTPPVSTFPPNLSVLKGKEDKIAKLWQYYRQLDPVLAPLHLSIAELELNNRQSVSLVLSNGIQLFLGQSQVLFRLQRFVKLYPQIFASASATAESVDLRYENGLTVKWRQTAPALPKH